MAERLVIAGAGGFGRGVYSWVTQSACFLEKNDIADVVFIDDSGRDEFSTGKIISSITNYYPNKYDRVLVAVGASKIRRSLVSQLNDKKARFHTFVDDRAIVAENAVIGEGTIVCPGTVISAHVTIGKQAHLNFNCSIGHDVEIGDFATLSPMSNVMGETVIGNDVFVGGSATVLPRISIKEGTVIGAAAVVNKSVNWPQTLVGNPAKEIRR